MTARPAATTSARYPYPAPSLSPVSCNNSTGCSALRKHIATMAGSRTTTDQDRLNSQYLSNSFAALASERSTNSLVSRTYKQASHLFLTKQFQEALEVIEPVLLPQATETSPFANGDDNTTGEQQRALVASCTAGTRTKVWVFYVSLLHSIISLGYDQGKLVFGSSEWQRIVNKVQDGSVWDEVVKNGYDGDEGRLDTEVVINLATLLGTHMPAQRLVQQRLESYLAASEGSTSSSYLAFSQDGVSTPMSNSSYSPKQLASRQRVLEIYTLHVLPANGEWEYAQQFIEMSDVLDEERKEQFLHALQAYKEQIDGTAQRDQELNEQREREMEEQRQEEARRAEEARRLEEEAKKSKKRKQPLQPVDHQKPSTTSKPQQNATNTPPTPPDTPEPSSSAIPTPTPSIAPARSSSSSSPKSQKKPTPRSSTPPTLYRRASSAIGNLQQMVLQASRNLTGQGTMAMLRFLMFMMAFLLIIARRDLRIKIRRAMETGWVKVKQTVGMGVKVSYV